MVALLLFCLGGFGCAANKELRQSARLELTLTDNAERFWQGMRWENYGEAGGYAEDPEAWQAFEAELIREGARFNITHAEVTRVVVALPENPEDPEDKPEGRVTVRLEITTLPSNRLEVRYHTQTWVNGKWGWSATLDGDELSLFLLEDE